jgi:hypothetical protein
MTYPLEFKQKFVYQENERGIFIPLTLVYGAKTTTCGANSIRERTFVISAVNTLKRSDCKSKRELCFA